jgi:hypothetical protein
MGFFSIIETFFFISLGITIILVALLVYHFKERLSSVEKNYESLFDIVAGVVKQLSNIQRHVNPSQQSISQLSEIYNSWTGQEHLGNITVSSEYPNQMFGTMRDSDLHTYLPTKSEPIKNNDIIELDNESGEDDASDEDDDSNEDDASGEDDESGEDDDSNEDDASDEDDDINIEYDDFPKVIVSDDELADVPKSSDDSVKIISLNVGENETTIDEMDITPMNLDDSQDIDDVYESPVQDIQIDYLVSAELEDTSIVVKKVDDIQNDQSENTFIIERSSVKDLYKKMSLSNLKATVISKGLCSDPSKMKKNELLKLLEDE